MYVAVPVFVLLIDYSDYLTDTSSSSDVEELVESHLAQAACDILLNARAPSILRYKPTNPHGGCCSRFCPAIRVHFWARWCIG